MNKLKATAHVVMQDAKGQEEKTKQKLQEEQQRSQLLQSQIDDMATQHEQLKARMEEIESGQEGQVRFVRWGGGGCSLSD